MQRVVPLVATLAFLAPLAARGGNPPPSFVDDALCVHSGWHYTHTRQHGAPDYVLWGVGHWRTSKTWSNGEGTWNEDSGNGYFNGLQFTLHTWQSVRGDKRWDDDPSGAPVSEQIARAYAVWLRDHDSWSEWGSTKTACGLG